MRCFFDIVIDRKQFTTVDRPSLNFQSFAWFSIYSQKLNIPIHPQWETYPGWHIDITNENSIKQKGIYLVDLKNVTILNGIKLDHKIKAINNDLQLFFDVPAQCSQSPHIGLEMVLNKEFDGWSQIFYAIVPQAFRKKKV